MMRRKLVVGLLSISALVMTSPAMADCYPSKGCWGAVAAATWRYLDGTSGVSVGSAVNYSSASAATAAAKEQCRLGSEGNMCELVDTFSGGACGYITSGKHNSRGVRWAAGPDFSDTYDRCSINGFVCDLPIGGCTSAPD